MGSSVDKPPPKFWSRPSTIAVLQQMNAGKYNVQQAQAALNDLIRMMGYDYTPPDHRVLLYAKRLREQSVIYSPDWQGYRKDTGKGEVVLLTKEEMERVTASTIKWSEFFGMPKDERFDLRVVCAMFYASERIASASDKVIRKANLGDLRRRSQEYIATWAERFGKYAFAASLGEFRHRRKAGKVQMLPTRVQEAQHGRHLRREAAQAAAMMLWPHTDKVKKAAETLVSAFADQGNFAGGFGGQPWAKIAKTFLQWFTKEIPDIVFADYVWDLSHNGGRFFDKCSLFLNEPHVRALLDVKRNAKEDFYTDENVVALLHPDWKAGLEMLEIAAMPGPEEA